jgi:DtxR family Mn-dependent transcriptional regulator
MMDALEPIVTDEILEDCLQAVQRSADQGRAATAADVTAFAHIPAPTAEAALRELRARGLLDSGSNGLALSEEGRRQAAAVIRRHRLSERLLTDVLGLLGSCPDEARLEPPDPRGEARRRLLNAPRPRRSQGAASSSRPGAWIPLPPVRCGSSSRKGEAALLRYLASLGLLPKAQLTVEVAPSGAAAGAWVERGTPSGGM